jgi:hypothetical protein
MLSGLLASAGVTPMRRKSMIVAALLLSGPAQAQVMPEDFNAETVASLQKLCSVSMTDQPNAAYAIGFCYGWLEGAGQFYQQLFLDPRFKLKPLVCSGGELTREQARTTFLDWATAHPTEGMRPALSGVIAAMTEKFPCK